MLFIKNYLWVSDFSYIVIGRNISIFKTIFQVYRQEKKSLNKYIKMVVKASNSIIVFMKNIILKIYIYFIILLT